MTCFVWVWLICIVCNHLVYPVAHLVGFCQRKPVQQASSQNSLCAGLAVCSIFMQNYVPIDNMQTQLKVMKLEMEGGNCLMWMCSQVYGLGCFGFGKDQEGVFIVVFFICWFHPCLFCTSNTYLFCVYLQEEFE